MSSPDAPLSEDGDERIARQLDDLLAQYVEKLNAGETLDMDRVLEEHPTLGPAIVEELATFVALTPEGADSQDLGTLGDYALRRVIGRGGDGSGLRGLAGIDGAPGGPEGPPRRTPRRPQGRGAL